MAPTPKSESEPKRLDDGRVEVAVQQRDADGGWGELQRPDARFLPADVSGEWRMSSPVGLTVAAAMEASDAMETMPDASGLGLRIGQPLLRHSPRRGRTIPSGTRSIWSRPRTPPNSA